MLACWGLYSTVLAHTYKAGSSVCDSTGVIINWLFCAGFSFGLCLTVSIALEVSGDLTRYQKC